MLLTVWLGLGPTHSNAGIITAKGSDTLVVLAQKWAEAYMRSHPEVKIQVTGGGTGTGLAALQNQTTDLCHASRAIRLGEIANCLKAFGKRPTEYAVAMDGLAIYVNARHPLKEISLTDLERVFTGRVRSWKELGGPDSPIVIYSRESSSGTYELFKEQVLRGKDLATSAQTMPGAGALLRALATDVNGIGYGGSAHGTSLRRLGIKKDPHSPAVEPSRDDVTLGRYPIARSLFIYVNPERDRGEVRDYLRWIQGPEGQALVQQAGYFPIPSAPIATKP